MSAILALLIMQCCIIYVHCLGFFGHGRRMCEINKTIPLKPFIVIKTLVFVNGKVTNSRHSPILIKTSFFPQLNCTLLNPLVLHRYGEYINPWLQ